MLLIPGRDQNGIIILAVSILSDRGRLMEATREHGGNNKNQSAVKKPGIKPFTGGAWN